MLFPTPYKNHILEFTLYVEKSGIANGFTKDFKWNYIKKYLCRTLNQEFWLKLS